MDDKYAQVLSDAKKRLLVLALDCTVAPGSTLPALKFRAEHHPDISSLDELEREGLLKRDGGNYIVSAAALPLVGSPQAIHFLGQIELLYGALRRRYFRDQDRQVPVATLADEVGMSRAIVDEALQRMQDISIWCAGRSTDLRLVDAFVTPAEAILKYETYGALLEQVRRWSNPSVVSPLQALLIDQQEREPSGLVVAPDVERELSPSQARGLFAALEGLEAFRIKPNDYLDDPEPRAFIDNVLTGMLKTLKAYCDSIGWPRLAQQLADLIPQRGDALEDIDLIQGFIVPEVRRLAVVRMSEPTSPVPVPAPLIPSTTTSSPADFLAAWPAVRACLQELSFYDIKEVTGLGGLDVTTLGHLDQKQQGGASKGQLMTAVDRQYVKMLPSAREKFLTIVIEEVLRRRPQSQDKLSEYLDRLGWSFVDQTLVPIQVLSPQTLDDTPEECRKDLLKAAQRFRDGDLSGAISAACGAVDSATAMVYRQMGLGDPTDASFQEACKKAAQAKGVLTTLDEQLNELGWPQSEIVPFHKNLEGALNQGAYVMQTLRSKMGDVHGSKPILRSVVFDCLRWAELIVGSLVARELG